MVIIIAVCSKYFVLMQLQAFEERVIDAQCFIFEMYRLSFYGSIHFQTAIASSSLPSALVLAVRSSF